MRAILFAVAVSVTACGEAPTSPSALAPPRPAAAPPGPGPIVITVTDGWTGIPVAGAALAAQGSGFLTDQAGQVTVTMAPWECATVEVRAPGYLPRRTCASATVTLWPVADEAEAEATRSAAFLNDRLLLPATPARVELAETLRQRPDVVAVWNSAAERIRAQTSGRLVVQFDYVSDEGSIVTLAATPPACTARWFTWSFAVAGFCLDRTDAYFVTNLTVDPDRVTEFGVALRALLHTFGMQPHRLAGAMNATHPQADLSPFERKTLHMMSLRATQRPVIWPDFDVVR